MVLTRGLRIALFGIVIGELGSAWLSRSLANMRIAGPGDNWIYLICGFLLFVSAGLASFVPARRAARVDPLQTLKYE
jgi:ABC-type lipoprotein release transport system permease subunit